MIIISKTAEITKRSFVLIRTFGLKVFIAKFFKTYCWKIPKFGFWVCDKANKIIADYLRNTVVKDMDLRKIPICTDCEPCVPRVIWIMWWQGIEKAPEMVKFCVSQIQKMNPECEMRIIDQNNYTDYVEIPESIIHRVKRGELSVTHLSDMIRLRLLAQYGGIWTDSTLLMTAPLEDAVFSSWFYSIRLGQRKYAYAPSEEKFVTFFMAAPPMSPLFLFAEQFMLCYFARFDTMIDYLLQDFAIKLAGECIPGGGVQAYMDAVPANNDLCFDLESKMNQPLSKGEEYLNSKTTMFKLFWKHDYVKEVNGVETVYGYLTKGEK